MASSKKISFFKNCKRNTPHCYYLLCVLTVWLLFFVPQTKNTLIKQQHFKFSYISLESTLTHFSMMISSRTICRSFYCSLQYSSVDSFIHSSNYRFFFSHDGECIPSSRYWAASTEENSIADGHKNSCKNIYRRYDSLIAR